MLEFPLYIINSILLFFIKKISFAILFGNVLLNSFLIYVYIKTSQNLWMVNSFDLVRHYRPTEALIIKSDWIGLYGHLTENIVLTFVTVTFFVSLAIYSLSSTITELRNTDHIDELYYDDLYYNDEDQRY